MVWTDPGSLCAASVARTRAESNPPSRHLPAVSWRSAQHRQEGISPRLGGPGRVQARWLGCFGEPGVQPLPGRRRPRPQGRPRCPGPLPSRRWRPSAGIAEPGTVRPAGVVSDGQRVRRVSDDGGGERQAEQSCAQEVIEVPPRCPLGNDVGHPILKSASKTLVSRGSLTLAAARTAATTPAATSSNGAAGRPLPDGGAVRRCPSTARSRSARRPRCRAGSGCRGLPP
jgi:hypothetical protein